MEKKELREGLRKRMEKHEFLSGGLYRSDIYHDPNQTGNTSGYITTVTENVLDFILEELDKAREEGIREAVEEAYEYGRDSIRLPMSLTKEQVIDKLLKTKEDGK